jgi:NTE family protein
MDAPLIEKIGQQYENYKNENYKNENCKNENYKSKIDTLVCSGGGSKGIAYVGIIKYLDEIKKNREIEEKKDDFDETKCIYPKIDIRRISCVSIGCFMGLLYSLNYNYEELKDEIENVNFETMSDIKLRNFLQKYGLESGKKIIEWLESFLVKKGYSKDVTFLQLYKKTGIHLEILASNINKYKLAIFDYKNTPKLKVLRAIRMSISIPFLFSVEKYKGDIHVDGGLISNYPIHFFKDDLSSVLGCKLVTMKEMMDEQDIKIENFSDYMSNVLQFFMLEKERRSARLDKYISHTITIDAYKVTNLVNYNLSSEEKKMLIESGYNSAKEFFENNKKK